IVAISRARIQATGGAPQANTTDPATVTTSAIGTCTVIRVAATDTAKPTPTDTGRRDLRARAETDTRRTATTTAMFTASAMATGNRTTTGEATTTQGQPDTRRTPRRMTGTVSAGRTPPTATVASGRTRHTQALLGRRFRSTRPVAAIQGRWITACPKKDSPATATVRADLGSPARTLTDLSTHRRGL